MFAPENLLLGSLVFLSITLLIGIINALVLTRVERFSELPDPSQSKPPGISVLVPARNEEANISQCIRSLLAQDYPNLEIIALDDHSIDRTGSILKELADQNGHLRVIQGESLPDGWLGKNWACHQLYQAASKEFILFVDADTTHHPSVLRNAVSVMITDQVDMLTALPKQVVVTWGEKLIVPILYWSLMCFLPLPIAYRMKLPVFSVAIGQFLLFRRKAYDQIGGYAAIRGHGADDLALARLIKTHYLPWRLVDGGERVSTRMYRNFQQAYEGFSKNLFAAFDYRILPFLFVWLAIGVIYYEPPIILILGWIGIINDPATFVIACLAIVESLLVWGLVTWRLRFPRLLFLVYPIIITLGVFTAMRSIVLSLRGRSTWKGRTLARAPIKWI